MTPPTGFQSTDRHPQRPRGFRRPKATQRGGIFDEHLARHPVFKDHEYVYATSN